MMKLLIIAVLVVAIISGVLFWKFGPSMNQKPVQPQEITLNYWAVNDDEAITKAVIQAYKKVKPKVTINYTHQSLINYRNRLQTQISNGQGPDVFVIHNTWIPMFLQQNALSSMPTTVMSADDYVNSFYPVVKETQVANKKIYSIPGEIDGLALYYNEEILKAAGVGVPKNWDEFVNAAIKMTVMDQSGNVKTAGAALGTTTNIPNWPDIVGLLLLQDGANLEQPNNARGIEAINFYTQFNRDPQKKVWDSLMDTSVKAFAQGKVAFYFGTAADAREIKTLNPQLIFKTTPVPQLPGRNIGWATFWTNTVSSRSLYQEEAWEFVKFLTSEQAQKYMYRESVRLYGYGKPYSLVSLQSELTTDPVMGAFVNQGPIYRSWYLSSGTGDQGINDEIIKAYEPALTNSDPANALTGTASNVLEILIKYGVIAPPPVR